MQRILLSLALMVNMTMAATVLVATDKSAMPNWDALLTDITPHFSEIYYYYEGVAPEFAKYSLVILDGNYKWYTPQLNSGLAQYVAKGGNVMLTSGIPYFLAGQTRDLSSISTWLGAGYYGNIFADNISMITTANAGEYGVKAGESLYYRGKYMDGGASLGNLAGNAKALATFDRGYSSGADLAITINQYGKGMVCYTSLGAPFDVGEGGATTAAYAKLIGKIIKQMVY